MARYHDPGSNQDYYYDPSDNTFYVYIDNSTQPASDEAADPSNFLQTVNYFRSLYGLHAWHFDPYLYNRAVNNNAFQRANGLGHFDVPSAQNSAWGNMDVMSVLRMWANSPAHAATLFGAYSSAALAFDGLYWTLNAR